MVLGGFFGFCNGRAASGARPQRWAASKTSRQPLARHDRGKLRRPKIGAGEKFRSGYGNWRDQVCDSFIRRFSGDWLEAENRPERGFIAGNSQKRNRGLKHDRIPL